jgi:hypothetical protein
VRTHHANNKGLTLQFFLNLVSHITDDKTQQNTFTIKNDTDALVIDGSCHNNSQEIKLGWGQNKENTVLLKFHKRTSDYIISKIEINFNVSAHFKNSLGLYFVKFHLKNDTIFIFLSSQPIK